MLKKDAALLHDFQQSCKLEWLEANGLGGWSSSSVIGCNTRRYHGLLVAATDPPTERMNLVNKLDETIVINNQRYELGVNNYGHAISPNGNQYLFSFERGIFPSWTYEVPGVQIKKTIGTIQEENTVAIIYEVVAATGSFNLELSPLMSVRGYHELMHANDSVHQDVNFTGSTFCARLYDNTPFIYIKIPGAKYVHHPEWFYHFNYSEEKNRGLDYTEDLFNHGHFTVELKKNDILGIIMSTEDPSGRDAVQLLKTEKNRREQLLGEPFNHSTIHYLNLAADQFIVQREQNLKTVIAGYHWFTDWGRDTMIALPGLALVTGRFEDARKIIVAFAQSVSEGMLPNRFTDHGEAPEYNQADGTLWYFVAVYKYFQVSGNSQFVLQEILPVLKTIIDWHLKGTRYHIQVSDDGLLFAGEPGQQLTWMDARIGDWVVTPRTGKPVEIQALWFNALKIFAYLLERNNEKAAADPIHQLAEKARKSFSDHFWNNKQDCLYDNIDEKGIADDTIRPNQIIALALPFPLITGRQAGLVLNVIEEKLYTPVGLRSLDPASPHFVPKYEGDLFHRDGSYHQGTVWNWLLGPYIDATVSYSGSAKKAQEIIDQFRYHLNEACIGSVSEIFDGTIPYQARGCIAQAWSVAEILRVMKQYSLH